MDPTCGPWDSLTRAVLPFDRGLSSAVAPLDLPPPSFFRPFYPGAIHFFDLLLTFPQAPVRSAPHRGCPSRAPATFSPSCAPRGRSRSATARAKAGTW